MNQLPNILTLSRLGLAMVLMALLALPLPYAKSAALAVFIIAAITDYLDGYLARSFNQVTSFGQLMDPLTDKVMIAAAFVSFVELQLPDSAARLGTTSLVPAWIVVPILGREFAVTGLRLVAATRGEVLSAGTWGKHKTVWQIIAVVVILLGLAVRQDILPHLAQTPLVTNFDLIFGYVSLVVSLAVLAITLASGYMYFREHRSLLRSRRSQRRRG